LRTDVLDLILPHYTSIIRDPYPNNFPIADFPHGCFPENSCPALPFRKSTFGKLNNHTWSSKSTILSGDWLMELIIAIPSWHDQQNLAKSFIRKNKKKTNHQIKEWRIKFSIIHYWIGDLGWNFPIWFSYKCCVIKFTIIIIIIT
jgi:hypothetical protein